MNTDKKSVALTERRIRDAKPRAGEDQTLWDTEVRGFGVRIAPGGTKSFLLMYRAGGRQRRWTFGRCGEMSLTDARNTARREMAAIRLGERDPASTRKEETSLPTVADGLARYFREYAPHRIEAGRMSPRTVKDYTAQAARVEKRIGKIRIADVTRGDIEEAVRGIAPVQCNRTLAFLSSFFNLCERWEYRPQQTNPARMIERSKEEPRDRTMSPSELARLGATLETHGDPHVVGVVKFLMLTGWRTGEALALEWDQVDFETGQITLPTTKTGRAVRNVDELPLRLLADLPRVNGEPRIFPFTYGKLYRHFRQLCRSADLADCRLHDIRRTVATDAASAGLSVFLLRDLLGHKTVAMSNRYARQAGAPLQDAQAASAARMAAMLQGKAAEVVPIRKAK